LEGGTLTDWSQAKREDAARKAAKEAPWPSQIRAPLGHKSVWYKFSPDPQHVLTYVHAFLRVVTEHQT